MKDIFKTFINAAANGIANGIYEHVQELRAQYKQERIDMNILQQSVCLEWLKLIENEGTDAAKCFMELCRERQYSPSSHLDLREFLEAGKMAMKVHNHPPINSTI